MTEVMVGGGANGVIGSAFTALLNDGDEFVCFEPAFPMYFDHTQLNGGKLVTCPLFIKDG